MPGAGRRPLPVPLTRTSSVKCGPFAIPDRDLNTHASTTPARGAGMSSGKRRLVTAVLSAAIVMLAAGAHAQTLGVRSGASVGPDQFFVGATYELGPYWNNRIWVRPGADAGFGNDLTLITGSFDVIHWRPVGNGRNPWMMFGGAGPSINHYRFTGFPSSTETGASVLAGVMHPS